MIQNLKIDIIYYDTPSDFEFEFNLGGCCHSRVLNSRTSSPKEMIASLSKAVGRSRVILIIGKLDGADGLFGLISKAISLPLKQVDAEEYGIVPGTDTTVIADALPLVSTDGLLAGCIIESGPQSIILLPAEKALRKDIAENLVFQYITAVSRTPDTETVVTPDSEPTEATDENQEDIPVLEEQPDESEAPTDIAEEINEEAFAEENSLVQEIFADEPVTDTANEEYEEITADDTQLPDASEENNEQFVDIYAESTEDAEAAVLDDNYVYNTTSESVTDEEYDDFEDEDDDQDDYEDEKKPASGINTFIWIILGLMFIIVAVLVYMLVYTPLKGGADIIEYIGQVLNV